MIVDEILDPPRCIVPDASPVYDELLAYVERRYADKPRDTRAIILSIAYTKTCRMKKGDINKTHNANANTQKEVTDNKTRIKTIIKNAQDVARYEVACREAVELFESLRQEVKQGIMDEVKKTIRDIIYPSKGLLTYVKEYLLYAAHHCGILLLCLVYLTLATAITGIVFPKLLPFIFDLMEEIVRPMRSKL